MAYELCEDKFKEGVMYMEMRASPHLLVGKQPSLTPREVMKCIVVGMQRGENDFGIKCRFIICCMRNLPGEYQSETTRCGRLLVSLFRVGLYRLISLVEKTYSDIQEY